MKDRLATRYMSNGHHEKYQRLLQLSRRANLTIILELLTALYLAKDDLKKRDRLNQVITYILVYGPWRKSLNLTQIGVESLSFFSNFDDSLLNDFFDVASSLPLTWADDDNHCYYASLPGEDLLELTETLIRQPAFRKKFGADTVIMKRYFSICRELLDICELNREQLASGVNDPGARGSIWCSFLVSTVLLGDIPATYNIIRTQLSQISLPLIPFFDVSDRHWLLSIELITESLRYAYVQLLEHAYDYSLPIRA